MGKMRRATVMAVGVVLVFLLFNITAGAAEDAASKWEFEAVSYLWFPAMHGTATVQGQKIKVSDSISDVFNETHFSYMAHLQARKGRWGFFADPMYSYFTTDGSMGQFDGRVKTKWWLIGFGGLYRLIEWGPKAEGSRMSFVDALVGAKYWELDNKIELDKPTPIEVEKDTGWVDPFVGLHFRTYLTEKLFIDGRGDIGGFDAFGDSSHFAWNAYGGVGYHLTESIALWAGYRALGVNRDEGRGANRFKWSTTFYGPALVVNIDFFKLLKKTSSGK